jgi:hypothetical protein
MDTYTYCDNLASELAGWRSRFGMAVSKLDRNAAGSTCKGVSQVNDLQMVIEELDDRIDRLKTQCPTEWEPGRAGFAREYSQMETSWKAAWENVSPGDIGG